MIESPLPPQLADALETERELGEQLLWAGQPDPFRAAGGAWIVFLLAIPWTVFAVFWETMVLGLGFTRSVGTPQPVAWSMALFGLPFIALGIGMLSAPFRAMAKARRTVYTVTTKRVLTLICGNSQETHSLVPRYLGDIRRTERRDGSGSLVICAATVANATTSGGTFLGIARVRDVEQIIKRTFFVDVVRPGAIPTFGVGVYRHAE